MIRQLLISLTIADISASRVAEPLWSRCPG